MYQCLRKRPIFVLYLYKGGSDGEVLVKTEFLGLAEVKHPPAEGTKQSIISKNIVREPTCRISQCLKKFIPIIQEITKKFA